MGQGFGEAEGGVRTVLLEAETGREGHVRRVAATARSIAEAMGTPGQEVIVLEDAARLHDVGERLLPTVGFDSDACRIVGAHHERLDGSGYPDRLTGRNMLLGTQVLAVAETFEAMTNPRLRREATDGRLNKQAVETLAEISNGTT